MRKCDICGLPVGEWPDRHEFHNPGCPKFVRIEDRTTGVPACDCTCDLVAHLHCCPQCRPQGKGKYEAVGAVDGAR
jgi:hypothetical protein